MRSPCSFRNILEGRMLLAGRGRRRRGRGRRRRRRVSRGIEMTSLLLVSRQVEVVIVDFDVALRDWLKVLRPGWVLTNVPLLSRKQGRKVWDYADLPMLCYFLGATESELFPPVIECKSWFEHNFLVITASYLEEHFVSAKQQVT